MRGVESIVLYCKKTRQAGWSDGPTWTTFGNRRGLDQLWQARGNLSDPKTSPPCWSFSNCTGPSFAFCSFAPSKPTLGWPLPHLTSLPYPPSPLAHSRLWSQLGAGPSFTSPPPSLVRSHLRSQLGAGPLLHPPSSTSCSFASSKPTWGWPLLHLLFVRTFEANLGLAPPSPPPPPPLVRSHLRSQLGAGPSFTSCSFVPSRPRSQLRGGGGGPFLGPPPNALSLLPSGAMFPFAL